MEKSEDFDTTNRIAIIGTAGRFPGARSVDQFWRLLTAERTGTRWLSEAELLAEGVSRAEFDDPSYIKAGNFLEDMECFDAGFFGFSARDAAILDPQHRHFLETAWEALEDAAHMPETFDGRIGVFAGSGMQAYLPFNLLSNPKLVAEIGMFLLRHTGNDKDFMPTRLSYLLNLQGPSVAIQTACSTSLVAVHQAVNSLLAMECDMAIAGGVTIDLPHRRGYHYIQGEILSPDGRCRAFDDESQGTIFGSGAALVVLRRLDDALADGDDIRAVILGSAINNDGAQKAGYLAPSVDGQAEAAAEALAVANIDPATVTYVEAHGTGTPVGDPIELAALSQAYGKGGKGFAGIGSVKSNIGHLDTAAGAASLIKVVQAMRHRTLPATLHYKTPNRRFDIANSPFHVIDRTQPWPQGPTPRRAAVNSVGVGGTNAHVVIEEGPTRVPVPDEDGWRLFPFSARTPKALDGAKRKWLDFLAAGETPAPADMAFTLRTGRRAFDQRLVVAARDATELAAALSGDAAQQAGAGAAERDAPEVVFMFPGGGAQYPGAGADLLRSSPAFRSAVEECFAQLPADAPADLRETMFERTVADKAARAMLETSAYAIPALFILEYAYAAMFRSWGVEPAAILAHSVGEYAGAVVAGAMSVEDALRIVTLRGRVMDAAPAGAMSVVPAPSEVVADLVGDALDIAAFNAPDLCVVSGELRDIEALEARLAGTDHEAKRIRIKVAAHSRILDGQLETFRAGFAGVTFARPQIPFVSSLRGDWGREDDFASADYWVRHLRNTVRFTQAVCHVLAKPNRILLEVGPHQTLSPLAEMSAAAHRPVAIVASGRQPNDEGDDMALALVAAGKLWAHGTVLDWAKLPGAGGRRVSLPTYAFERERHWIEPGKARVDAEAEVVEAPPRIERIPAIADWFEGFEWRETPIPLAEPRRSGAWLVFAGKDDVSRETILHLGRRGERVIEVRPAAGFAACGEGYVLRPGAAEDYEALFDALGAVPARILSLWPLEAGEDQAQIFDSAFGLARALQARDVPDGGARLVFATLGGVGALPGETVARPWLATLLGPVRVAPREIPGLAAQLIDLDPAMTPAAAAAALLEEQDVASDADRVAYRGRRRLTESRVRIEAPRPAGIPHRLRRGGVYVITGGLGGIGLELARHLGVTAQAKLALIGRSAMPEPADWDAALAADPDGAPARMIRVAREIEATGGALRCYAADVTDRGALETALDAARSDLGAIHGVFHAAGAIADAPLGAKTLDEAHAVLAPKLVGGRNLDALLPAGSLDVFAVFSSSSVQIAPGGQVDYVAANAYLEALAASRPDGLAIAWGIWRGVGMAARAYGRAALATAADAHPLLGTAAPDPNGAVLRFEATLDPEALWVLADHHVGGVAVLPGTAYVEIARAAFAAATGAAACAIEGLSLSAAMAFADGAPRRVRTTLTPRADGGFDAVVESAAGSEETFVEHGRAVVRPDPEAGTPAGLAASGDLAPSSRSGHPGSAALIEFGPRWQVLGEIRLGEGVAEAEAALPAEFTDDLVSFAAHPGLLDMAATIGLNLLSEASSAEGLYAPMSFERIRVFDRLTSRVVSRARLVDHQPERFVRFDVALSTPDGRPLMIIEGLDMRFVSAGALAAAADDATAGLTAQMLARGIGAADAPEVFDRALAAPASRLLVSSIPIKTIRDRIFHEMRAAARPLRRTGAADAAPVRFANPVEEKIADLFGALLGGEAIRPEDDFFQIGGHSLLSVRLFARIRQDLGVSLPMSTLFRSPTVRALAARVLEERPDLAPSAQKAGALATDAAPPPADSSAPPTDAAPTEAEDAPPDEPGTVRLVETTDGQREIFSAILIDPRVSKAYNLSFSLDISGPVDAAAMTVAVAQVFDRHDSLRSTFDPGGLTLRIAPSRAWETPHEDLSDLAENARADRLAALRRDEVETEIDLLNGPVARARLVTLDAQRHELLITVHHIVCDGWSIGVIMQEVNQAYNALARGGPPKFGPASSIAEFIAAETAWRLSPEARAHESYWLERFSGDIPVMDLLTDRPRPALKTANGARVDALLDPALAARLRVVARAEGSTLQNFVLAAFQLYLARITGQKDVVIGLPSSGQLSFGLETVVGHCVNFLPIRSQLDDGQSFRDFLGATRRVLMDALDHQNYTYGNLIKALRLPRDPSRVLLVPVIFNIDNLVDVNRLVYDGINTTFRMNPRSYEHFEIFFNLLDEQDKVRMDWAYNTDLFDRGTIERHVKRFVRLLEGLAEAPDTPLGATGRFLAAALAPAGGAAADPGAAGPQTILEVFGATARRHADRVAVRFGADTMDYATLDIRSDALAALLAARGVGPGQLVGISSRRCLELPVAVLGVLKAGAGYVPFDANLPAERLSFMAKDTSVKILLGECAPVSEAGAESIPFDAFPTSPALAPRPDIDGEAIAYVMYTSGTTGQPKGVVLPHRSVIRMLVDTDWVTLGPEVKTLHSSAFAFDTSIIDIFGALLHGGELVIPPDGALTLAALGQQMTDHGVTTLWLTSGLFHAMADERPEVFAGVREVIVGGDIVSPVQVAKVQATCPDLTVINGYGPTESNVTNAHAITPEDLTNGGSLPIGRAIPGTCTFVLDEALQPVEAGMTGELCIAGRGLALGYWNRPDLTAARFVPAPWDPAITLYRTGDIASDPGDGVLRFYGRMDTQVKIRGFRVELAEVEAALEAHPEVQLAAVVASTPEGRTDKVIVAYYVPTKRKSPSRNALMEHLKGVLPEFALPSFLQPIERIPLNQNGKVDRRALPPIDLKSISSDATAAATDIERSLTGIWRSTLGLEEIGVEANFFELGGHSLLAVRLFERIRETYAIDLPISTLFQNPTIRDLAGVIEMRTGSAVEPQAFDPEADWDTTTVIHAGPAGTAARALFIAGGVGGNVNNLYDLGNVIGLERPVIGLQTRGVLGHTPRDSIEAMAAEHLRYIRAQQPSGPYYIAGYSGGALTALEIARQLRAQGQRVARLFILDSYAPGFARDFSVTLKVPLWPRLKNEAHLLRTKGLGLLLDRINLKTRGEFLDNRSLKFLGIRSLGRADPTLDRLRQVAIDWRRAAVRYVGGPFNGPVTLFLTTPLTLRQKMAFDLDPTLGWGAIATGALERVPVSGDHRNMVWDEGAEVLAKAINARLATIEAAEAVKFARAS